MTLGDKLAKLRREHHLTQEQLAERLGVSRQAVSKWESGAAYPETEKLLRLGALYGCSMDYLLTDQAEPPSQAAAESGESPVRLHFPTFERRSRRSVGGLPLWHVNFGPGRTAVGIVAVGFVARGVVSVGLVSLGVISFGLLSLGALALGVIALGLISAGSIACGILALGAISVGVVSIGALALGRFSVGAMAVGRYFAMGDNARAAVALGKTEAAGRVFQKIGPLTGADRAEARHMLDAVTPPVLSWAKALIQRLFLRS